MNEREQRVKREAPDGTTEDPLLEEHLRAVFAAAYPRVQPWESVQRRVTEAVAQHEAQNTGPTTRWQMWPVRWRPAVGAVAAAVLLAVLGLMLAPRDHRHSTGTPVPFIAGKPHPSRNEPEPGSHPRLLQNDHGPQIAKLHPLQPGWGETILRPLLPPPTWNMKQRVLNNPLTLHPQAYHGIDDLAYVNSDPEKVIRPWVIMPQDQWDRVEERVRRSVRAKDDFVTIPFQRLASTAPRQIAGAVESYKREAAIVDPRLTREITLQFKGIALSDLCDHLRADTGIELSAGPSVADEKMTIFCDKTRLRDVMRQLSRAFGYTWLRSGRQGAYKYALEQDLRSQLLEEELRNRDRDAALLALDAEMQMYRPYLDLSFEELKKRFEELKKRWGQLGEEEQRRLWDGADNGRIRQLWQLTAGNWGGVQLYYRLTARDRAALMAGQELVFKPDAPDPDRRLPAELGGPILQSLNVSVEVDDHSTPIAAAPDVWLAQVRLRLGRKESGALSLTATTVAVRGHTEASPRVSSSSDLATGRSPSVANPDNANAALRGQPPFDQVISLRPEPSCPPVKDLRPGDRDPELVDEASVELDRSQPYALSSDVWEAVHRATGLPIVADFYTHLYPIGKVTVAHRSLFEALRAEGDALGVRWRKEGDFLVCRSSSFVWDRLHEVPNRYLQRWARDRDAGGGLPLADFLEMARMSDQQFDSAPVAQGIEHYWGLREWARLRDLRKRADARCLAQLTPEQLRRALEPVGLPLRDLNSAQQQSILQLQSAAHAEWERKGGWSPPIRPEEFVQSKIAVTYIPAGWYAACMTPENVHVPAWTGPWNYVGGRTVAEATAAAHRLYAGASPQEVHYARDGFFSVRM